MKLGLVVFANDGGLGAQTRRLCYMLKPDRLLLVDSSSFSQNKDQHFTWYEGFSGYRVYGFPNNNEIKVFLKGMTHIIVCENPLNFYLLDEAARQGIKIFIQSNYEFCDHLNKELTLPYKFLMPSYWKVQEMKDKFGDNRVDYCPPPIDPSEFSEVREINTGRSGIPRLLHIVGTLAAHDRNGTLDLLRALPYMRADFELIIRSQHELPRIYTTTDRRVKFIYENATSAPEMYRNFDAMILPRRYGGLSLTTCEALMSGLPVIMPDISPNNELLPREWLVKAEKQGEFRTRTMIDIYGVDPKLLAAKIEQFFMRTDIEKQQLRAFEIGYNEFSTTMLKPKYDALLEQ